jgi:toxin ParE1/3/4
VSYSVFLTDSAVCDLEELDAYITRYDSVERADDVLRKIEKSIRSLSEQADRGVYPKELSTLGIREYREIFFKPYRIIYRVIKDDVYIYLIVDGRRDMQTLLERRLLIES